MSIFRIIQAIAMGITGAINGLITRLEDKAAGLACIYEKQLAGLIPELDRLHSAVDDAVNFVKPSAFMLLAAFTLTVAGFVVPIACMGAIVLVAEDLASGSLMKSITLCLSAPALGFGIKQIMGTLTEPVRQILQPVLLIVMLCAFSVTIWNVEGIHAPPSSTASTQPISSNDILEKIQAAKGLTPTDVKIEITEEVKTSRVVMLIAAVIADATGSYFLFALGASLRLPIMPADQRAARAAIDKQQRLHNRIAKRVHKYVALNSYFASWRRELKATFEALARSLAIVALGVLPFAHPQAEAKTVFAFTMDVDAVSATSIYNNQVTLAEALPRGETVEYISASDASAITAFEVPNDYKALRRATKINAHNDLLLDHLIGAVVANEGKETFCAANFPKLMEYASADSSIDTLVVVASPLYVSKDPRFSFVADTPDPVAGRWLRPYHSHIKATLEQSPFGTKGVRKCEQDLKVYWFSPLSGQFEGYPAYISESSNFWSLHASELNAALMCMDSGLNRMKTRLFESPKLKPIDAIINASEHGFKMRFPSFSGTGPVEIAGYIDHKKLSAIALFDTTSSMKKAFHRASMDFAQTHVEGNAAVILYNDNGGKSDHSIFFYESDSPDQIASAMRNNIKLQGGLLDAPEDLACGLARVKKEIEQRESENVAIRIYTDSPAKGPEDSYKELDYKALMNELLDAGHSITLVRCSDHLSDDWLVPNVIVEELK